MGNTIAHTSQEVGGRCGSKIWTRHCELYPQGMMSKPPSFLEEPETDKRTERGEAAVSLNTDKDSENEREGPPGHTGGNGKL